MYWLVKTEPSAFSLEDWRKENRKTTAWDGIRNYQARNFIRDSMSVGDEVLIYYSSCPQPGIVGYGKITSQAYPDELAFDPESRYFDDQSSPDNIRWYAIDIQLKEVLKTPITREKLKQDKQLADMSLLKRGQRLSVLPVEKRHWQHIRSLADKS